MSARAIIQGYYEANQAKLESYYKGNEGISKEDAATLRGEQHAYCRSLEAIDAEQAAPAAFQEQSANG